METNERNKKKLKKIYKWNVQRKIKQVKKEMSNT